MVRLIQGVHGLCRWSLTGDAPYLEFKHITDVWCPQLSGWCSRDSFMHVTWLPGACQLIRSHDGSILQSSLFVLYMYIIGELNLVYSTNFSCNVHIHLYLWSALSFLFWVIHSHCKAGYTLVWVLSHMTSFSQLTKYPPQQIRHLGMVNPYRQGTASDGEYVFIYGEIHEW